MAISRVSVTDLKRHLNITYNDDADNALLGEKLSVASEWVSKYTGIPLDTCDPTVEPPACPTPMPAPVDEAIRQLAGHLYANREATLVGVTAQALPFGVLDLLTPYTPFVCG
jgi:hypothetical protein